MTQNIVGARRFFDPQWLEIFQLLHPFDRLINVEDLVRIQHERRLITDFVSHQLAAFNVAIQVKADLDLESCEAQFLVLVAQRNHFLVAIAKPAGRCSVSQISVLHQLIRSRLFPRLVLLQQQNRFRLRENIGAVAKVDAVHEKLKMMEKKV